MIEVRMRDFFVKAEKLDYETQCEFEDVDGDAFYNAFQQLAHSDEAPDSLSPEGHEAYAADRVGRLIPTTALFRCEWPSNFRVTICDEPQLIDNPDVSDLCYNHAHTQIGQFLTSLTLEA